MRQTGSSEQDRVSRYAPATRNRVWAVDNVHKVNIGTNSEQFAPEYLKINPNGKIPSIVDPEGPDGKPIAMMESGAILVYLAGKTGPLPAEERARARYEALQWLMFQMGGVGPMFGQAHHFMRAKKDEIPYGSERYGNEAKRLYGVMDKHLGAHDYFAPEYSIADMAIYPVGGAPRVASRRPRAVPEREALVRQGRRAPGGAEGDGGAAGLALGEHLGEVGRVHRLHQVQVEARLAGAGAVLRQAIAGHGDEIRAPRPVDLETDAPRELVAVHAGQADVDERDLGHRSAHGFEAGDAVGGDAHAMAIELEQPPQRLARIRVVFDDQHLARLDAGRRGRHARQGRGLDRRQAYGEGAALAVAVALRARRSRRAAQPGAAPA